MKTTIEINGKKVEITLTDDQVKEITRKSINVMDRVKSFEDACKECGYDPAEMIPYSSPITPFQTALNGQAEVMIIAEALCEKWEPDYNDQNQAKYEPRFIKDKSGLGFSCRDFGRWDAYMDVGARLCFPTAELAKYAGTQFIDHYNKFLVKWISPS